MSDLSLPPAVAERFPRELQQRLVALRRDLHQNPELSFEEERTAAALERALEPLGCTLKRIAGTGIVARLRGRDADAPVYAVRGDIDALPIQEETGLPFASVNDGVMHACGHDIHATWAVGAAFLLAERGLVGDVVILLQPAEELGLGAAAMIEEGALEGVDGIFGAHVDRRFAVGEVVADPGPLAAATDSFEVEIVGAGGHGARPHLTRDPIVAAASLVTQIQTVVSRRVDPGHPAVVTIGSFQAGEAANVIPERASLSGTLRSTTAEVRAQLVRELEQLVRDVSAAYGCEGSLEVSGGTPPVVNTERESQWATAAARRLLGAEGTVPLGGTNMGGEDFAFFLEHVPGCFLRVGAREPGSEPIGAHTPRFYGAEESIFIGAAVLAEAVIEAQRAGA